MNEGNQANAIPSALIQGDVHVHNDNRNVDTDVIMSKLNEIQRMLFDKGHMGMTQHYSMPSTSQGGIPVSGTAASSAGNEMTLFDRQRLRETFNNQDKTSSLLQSNNFDEMLPILKKKVSLGKDLVYSQQLVLYITTAMQANSSKDTSQLKKIRKDLFKMIKKKLKPSGRTMKSLAHEFRIEGKSFEAVLLYFLASEFYTNEADGVRSARGIAVCCGGVGVTVGELIEKKSDSKAAVKQHILPLFGEFQANIQAIKNVPEEERIKCQAWCMHYVAYIHGHLEEYERMEESCRREKEMMESKLASSYMKHKVYGALLLNLSASFFNRQRPADAKRYWLQAVEAFSTAEDFVSADERKQMIELARVFLATSSDE